MKCEDCNVEMKEKVNPIGLWGVLLGRSLNEHRNH